MLNLQEIDDKGHLNVASNVRDLFCKWEEVCKPLKSQRSSKNGRENERGKDVSV